MRIATSALVLGLLALSACAMTAPTMGPQPLVGVGSEPSALPAGGAEPEGLFERYPETRIQAR